MWKPPISTWWRWGLVLVACCAAPSESPAADAGSTVPEVGIRDRAPRYHALTNARIVPQAGRVIAQGALIIRDGVIEAMGEELDVPPTARLWDMPGRTIYPALIDPYSEIEVSDSAGAAAYWNPHVRPERAAVDAWQRNAETDKQYRAAGFAVRLAAPQDGVFKGVSALVATGEGQAADSIVAARVAQHVRLTAPRGVNRGQYPSSPMGAVALARQSLYDAQWYRDAWRAFRNQPHVTRPDLNLALEALAAARDSDQLFICDAPDEQYALRADRFAREFGLRVVLRGSGREYQRLDAIRDAGRAVIAPVDFPSPPDVSSAAAAREATLGELMHWRLAPENPSRLIDAGITVALTAHGLKDKSKFREMVRRAVARGLDPDEALRACTSTPAQLLGVADKVGVLAVGQAANLMITEGDWLDEESKMVEVWVDGRRYAHEPAPRLNDLVGDWRLETTAAAADRSTLFLRLSDSDARLAGTISLQPPDPEGDGQASKEAVAPAAENSVGSENVASPDPTAEKKSSPSRQFKLEDVEAAFGRLSARFSAKLWGAAGAARLSGALLVDPTPRIVGELLDEQGRRIAFTGQRMVEPPGAPTAAPAQEPLAKSAEPPAASSSAVDGSAAATESSEATSTADEASSSDAAAEGAKDEPSDDAWEISYPLGAFGRTAPPPQPAVLAIENATLWTCGPLGVVERGVVLVERGAIVAVGADVPVPPDAERIDAGGKHVTPGIIDCHSHMATDGGINEASQAITAEVRIGDFVDATDIAIYRQLAGGVTTANVLHGSANPIGGQNQVIKLRWGMSPEELKFAEAPPGIKFALGENVKQSNWGDRFTSRYPQTRLGVEQLIRDAFLAAEEYRRGWQRWQTDHRGLPPRRDLELDALVEILEHRRWVHCHSYRQDEILALLRTLESFDVRIGTLQHILEGYKVAEEMQRHGAMASAFSDWWAYKFEVYDAIPYNGALMYEAGIVVSFNSDDRELARHLNQEAAKAVKYGGVPPIEALKFVTLNPARQLRIDQYVGSLEVGKQADLVIWSGPPLSIMSRCEQTWIDGRRYFDLRQDRELRERDARLRSRLVQMILTADEPAEKAGEREPLERDLWPREDLFCGRHGDSHDAH